MANKASNVTAGTPKVGGSIFHAVKGTTLPSDAKSTLDKAFAGLGYVSEDGVTQSEEIETNTVKAWGGDVVMASQTGKTFTYEFTLIEALNEEVQKLVHGADNVEGSLANGLTVKGNTTELVAESFVIEQIMNGDVLKRTVVPNGKITSLGEVTYKDGEAVSYDVTITAFPDDSGNSYYDYYVTSATTATVADGK